MKAEAEANREPVLNGERIARTMIAIGASAGGVQALTELFGKLPANFHGSVAAVLHRSPDVETDLAGVLGRRASLPVLEPKDREPILPGRIYVAPRDRHLVVKATGVLRRDGGPREHFTRPAADPLMRSVAEVFGASSVGVVLTGGGSDGVAGLLAIKAAGGITLVQDPDEAESRSMPWMSILKDHVDAILPLAQIAPALDALARGDSVSLTREVEPG